MDPSKIIEIYLFNLNQNIVGNSMGIVIHDLINAQWLKNFHSMLDLKLMELISQNNLILV